MTIISGLSVIIIVLTGEAHIIYNLKDVISKIGKKGYR